MKKSKPISATKTYVRRTEAIERIKYTLLSAGLQPTRTRVALALLLFTNGDRHVTAEALVEEAWRAKISVSVATIYNTLKRFTEVGFLRQVTIDSTRSFFDTNVTEHHHFYSEELQRLIHIPSIKVSDQKTPILPKGYEIARVDVVVRVRATK